MGTLKPQRNTVIGTLPVEFVCHTSNGAILNDREWSTDKILRARHYSTLNISETMQDRHTVTTDH